MYDTRHSKTNRPRPATQWVAMQMGTLPGDVGVVGDGPLADMADVGEERRSESEEDSFRGNLASTKSSQSDTICGFGGSPSSKGQSWAGVKNRDQGNSIQVLITGETPTDRTLSTYMHLDIRLLHGRFGIRRLTNTNDVRDGVFL